jgi:hypothetical protein
MSTTTPSSPTPRRSRAANPWAIGGSIFAATVMITIGIMQFVEGLVAVTNGNKFYIHTEHYIFEFNATAWGWTHLILGVIVAVAGAYIFTGSLVARSIGITVAALSALANFVWLPYFPLWAVIVIALDVAVIWSLATVSLAD